MRSLRLSIHAHAEPQCRSIRCTFLVRVDQISETGSQRSPNSKGAKWLGIGWIERDEAFGIGIAGNSRIACPTGQTPVSPKAVVLFSFHWAPAFSALSSSHQIYEIRFLSSPQSYYRQSIYSWVLQLNTSIGLLVTIRVTPAHGIEDVENTV